MNRTPYGRRFFDVDSDPIDTVVTGADDLATGAADVVDDATDAIQETLQDTVRRLTDALSVQGETNGRGFADISDRLARIESKFLESAQEAAADVAEVAGDVVDTGAAVPAAATGEIQAVIEDAGEPPVRKKRGMIGAMKKGGRKK